MKICSNCWKELEYKCCNHKQNTAGGFIWRFDARPYNRKEHYEMGKNSLPVM